MASCVQVTGHVGERWEADNLAGASSRRSRAGKFEMGGSSACALSACSRLFQSGCMQGIPMHILHSAAAARLCTSLQERRPLGPWLPIGPSAGEVEPDDKLRGVEPQQRRKGQR